MLLEEIQIVSSIDRRGDDARTRAIPISPNDVTAHTTFESPMKLGHPNRQNRCHQPPHCDSGNEPPPVNPFDLQELWIRHHPHSLIVLEKRRRVGEALLKTISDRRAINVSSSQR